MRGVVGGGGHSEADGEQPGSVAVGGNMAWASSQKITANQRTCGMSQWV